MAGRALTVVVDTNVFSADLLRATQPLVELYRLPSPAGASSSRSRRSPRSASGSAGGTGAPGRLQRAETHIGRAEVVWPGPALLAAQIDLRLACERAGHALAQRQHDVDRWIAATAVHLGVPLVSHDGVFRGTPGLTLETAL